MSKFLKVIVNLFLVCAILIAGAILVPPLLGVSTTVVDSSSMDTNLPIGSMTYSQEVNVAEISVGDKILVESDTEAYAYIVESADAGDGNYIVTDANDPQSESKEETLRNVALKLIITIPLIGYVMIAMRSIEGIIIIGLVVLFVIILFILSELWKNTDDEEEEDDEYEDEEAEQTEDNPVAAPVKENIEPLSEKYMDATTELTAEELARSIAEVQGESEDLADSEYEPEKLSADLPESDLPQSDLSESELSELDLSDVELSDEKQAVDDEHNSFIPVTRLTKEEILAKAQAANEEPEVVEYDDIGVTIIDYSDLL